MRLYPTALLLQLDQNLHNERIQPVAVGLADQLTHLKPDLMQWNFLIILQLVFKICIDARYSSFYCVS